MIGGYSFLVDTAMFASGKPLEGARFDAILAIWLVDHSDLRSVPFSYGTGIS